MQIIRALWLQRSYRFLMSMGLVLFMAVMLTACGFQLRGVSDLSFKTLNIQGAKLTISKGLRQWVTTNGVRVVDDANKAEAFLELMTEIYEKRIRSLSGQGLVREFELNYRVTFRTRDASSTLWGPEQVVQVRRDFSYNDTALLGKGEEEERLREDMRKDVIREIMRRLSAIKPTPTN
jgi:LPS-assembly lipoprotein